MNHLVPEVGLEPTSLAAEDFLPTSAFAADLADVRGLEHAFTLALRLQVPAVCSLHLPPDGRLRAWLGISSERIQGLHRV